MPQTDAGTGAVEKERPVFYHPDVLEKLGSETANRYQNLRGVMDKLQFNPWPPGAETDKYFGPEFARLEVDDLEPTTLFVYRVEDERIVVIFYEERKFKRLTDD